MLKNLESSFSNWYSEQKNVERQSTRTPMFFFPRTQAGVKTIVENLRATSRKVERHKKWNPMVVFCKQKSVDLVGTLPAVFAFLHKKWTCKKSSVWKSQWKTSSGSKLETLQIKRDSQCPYSDCENQKL